MCCAAAAWCNEVAMNFLNPIGWIFLSLAPLVVLLYLRRVRRRAVPVPTLLFWRRAMGEQRHRAFLGKLRQWFSLLLQLLILLLLILALVRPEPARLAVAGQSTLIVIDTRARMQALEPDGESRFAKALALARQTAARAHEGGSVAVLAVGTRAGAGAEVVSPFSADPSPLLHRLETVAPTDATGDLAPALALGRELLAARPGAHRLLLLTDGSDAPEGAKDAKGAQIADSTELEVVAVGSPRDNVAITRFAARPELASPQTADLLLEIANFGRKPAKGNVEISCDGTLLDVKPFSLEPGERKTDVFPALPAPANGSNNVGKLTARLDQNDSLPLDNVAYAMLPPNRPSRVLLVTRGNWFLEKLLASDPGVKFELLEPDSFAPKMASQFDAVIYDDCGPENLAGLSGNALFLKSSPLGNTGMLEKPLVTDTDSASPLLRLVEWRNVTFLRATEIAPAPLDRDGWKFQTPLRSFEHPLIVSGARGEQRLAVFAFDVADTDLPLRIAFPLLVSNTLHWLASPGTGGNGGTGGTGGSALGAIESGQAMMLAAGETAYPPSETAAFASGTAAAVPAARPASETAVHGLLQPLRNGFYRVENNPGTNAVRWIAANTFSDTESNLLNAPGKNHHAASRLSALGAAAVRPLWQWLILAAFALLLLEWWLFHRRHTE